LGGEFGGGTGLDEFFEEGGVALEGAVGGVDAALDEFEVVGGSAGGGGEGVVGAEFFGGFGFAVPELGFETGETVEQPSGADDLLQVGGLDGVGGAVGVVEGVHEGGEGGGVFATDDVVRGVEAVFECVLGGDGFACRGDGTARFGAVGSGGGDLFIGAHGKSPFKMKKAGQEARGTKKAQARIRLRTRDCATKILTGEFGEEGLNIGK
jgi:hypothetical protein